MRKHLLSSVRCNVDFVSYNEEDMLYLTDTFPAACVAFELAISLKKTSVLFTSAPDEPYTDIDIYVDETRLGVVDTFSYLNSILSRDGHQDAEIVKNSEGHQGLWEIRKKRVYHAY